MHVSETIKEKHILSGVKPTGRIHVGNYFGAVKQFVALQESNSCVFFIADYHAITTDWDPETLRRNTYDLALDYLALGLDPQQSIVFKQSDVPEVIELSWIFSCLIGINHLKRAHAYKSAVDEDKAVSLGVFAYPVLMSADILLYNADYVPVGFDQKQHLEIAADIAARSNNTFGELFTVPAPLILSEEMVIGTDGRKMSKSYDNTILMFEQEDVLRKKIMSITTDSKGVGEAIDPETCNVFALHRLFSADMLADIQARYEQGGIGYKESKELLFENILAYTHSFREKRKELEADPERVYAILAEGAEQARVIAQETLRRVRDAVGVSRGE